MSREGDTFELRHPQADEVETAIGEAHVRKGGFSQLCAGKTAPAHLDAAGRKPARPAICPVAINRDGIDEIPELGDRLGVL